MEKVIVYRSQSEANTDEFLNEILFPWIYDHWIWIAGGIVLFILYYLVANRRKY
jgi:hypothetical protein